LPERLNGIKKALYNMADYAVSNNINHIIFGGDIYHGKSIIHSLAQNILIDFLRNYSMLNFIIISGNHDLSDRGIGAVSALKHISSESNVTYISKPLKIGEIMYVPYSADMMIDSIKNNSARYLVSHFGLNEGLLSSGISIISDIKLSDLIGKYDIVLLGHYHRSQEIIRDDIRLYYAGSLIELDYGERDNEKRFLVVDTENDIIESISSIGFKKHFRFELTIENKEEVVEKARQLKKEGHYIQITQIEQMDISDLREEFQIINKVSQDITNRGLTSSMSMRDKLKKYLEIKKIPNEEQEDYLRIGFEIINLCSGEM